MAVPNIIRPHVETWVTFHPVAPNEGISAMSYQVVKAYGHYFPPAVDLSNFP